MSRNKNKDDLHIAILKYGRDKLEAGVTFEELKNHIDNLGYEVSNDRMKHYLCDSYEASDILKRGSPFDAIEEKLTFVLTVESTFRLIEYEEFKSANKSSRTATRFATGALVVSILSAWASVHFSMKQLNTETSINKNQLNELLKLKYDDSNINKNILEIINNQELSKSSKKPNKRLWCQPH